LEFFATIEKDHVLSGKMSFDEHTGTHLDAPNHFVAGQVSVDKIPLKQLFGPAVVLDVRQKAASNADYQLSPSDIADFERAHGRIPDHAIVFMYSGWDERWNDYEKYKNADAKKVMHFPGFSGEAVKLLVEERNISGIGIDTLSVDYGMSTDFMVHHIAHGKGKFHLENVANLGSIPAVGAFVIVAPIKVEHGTGGPARIFALVKK
jgi:kynurenine formamidase